MSQERPPLKATIIGRFDDNSFRERYVLGKTMVEAETVTWNTRVKVVLYADGSGTLSISRLVGESIKQLHQHSWGAEYNKTGVQQAS